MQAIMVGYFEILYSVIASGVLLFTSVFSFWEHHGVPGTIISQERKRKIIQNDLNSLLKEKFQNHSISSDEKIVSTISEMFLEILRLLRQKNILTLPSIK